ncbi:rhodanese-like domain-containing protein [Agrobacterium tumefaciens]|uniref:rhodanese-like domain-containing protein n=1 Tax=Agrobacterium tumefaciens complex TaxID=1183400 RepID=UPI001572D002|nr:rhodanese-like domain-containing protein [Agrobacterium fabrum]NSZ09693.1 rhodanese-like domain-containing protein [Agrobacterium tumefaciens]
MTKTLKYFLDEANAAVPKLETLEIATYLKFADTLVVDVREKDEVRASGKIRGAINIPRGMLEFYADPTTRFFDPSLQPNRPVLLYCGQGPRAALAGKTLVDLGFLHVFNIGGFKELTDAGFEIE